MMKKIVGCILIVTFIFGIMSTNLCYAAEITLDQIASKFNESKTVKQYEEAGAKLEASSTDNKLIINLTAQGTTSSMEYTLNGNILSGTMEGENAFKGALISVVVVDTIGQLHGYEEGELLATVNSKEIEKYTLEKEGLEISHVGNESFTIKIDLTKKIPMIDFSNTYIEVADLQEFKQFIVGNGSAQISKGNVTFHKRGFDDEATVVMAEKDKLTENAYKSILSVLEVMFDSQKTKYYFKENYPSNTFENKEFGGFKIEVNPEKSDSEKFMLGEDDKYKFVRISIDKSKVNEALSSYEIPEEPKVTEDPNITKEPNITDEPGNTKVPENTKTPGGTKVPDKIEDDSIAKKPLPNTGATSTIVIVILAVLIVGTILYLKTKEYDDIK